MSATTVPPDIKAFRKAITKKYGYITLAIAFAFILITGLINYFGPLITPKKLKHRLLCQRWYRQSAPKWTSKAMIAGWSAILAIVIFKDTFNDWTFLVKRLGRVSVALMPPTYFLTLRPSPLPQTFYLQLLPFHKWLSRSIVLLSLVHALLYTWIYFQNGKLRKLLKIQNICGIFALLSFLALGLTSIRFFRRRMYNVFFGIHYTLAWTTVGLVWYHSVPPSNEYIAMCIAILLGQIAYRVKSSQHIRLPVQYISPSLLLVSMPKNELNFFGRNHYFTPGSHVRISFPLTLVSTWFQSSHPYTIASLPHEQNVQLVVRKTQFPIKLRQVYSIYGPFNSIPPQVLLDAQTGQVKRALFIIGGSGIAFGAPVLRYLKAYGVAVKLLWAVRDARDVKALEPLGLDSALKHQEIEVYVTSGPVPQQLRKRRSSFGSAAAAVEQQIFGEHQGNEDEDLDVIVDNLYCAGPEQQPLITGSDFFKSYSSFEQQIQSHPSIFNYRPVLNMRLKSWLCGIDSGTNECCCADQMFLSDDDLDKSGAWVIASGAERLVHETQKWAQQNKFTFYQEEFTL